MIFLLCRVCKTEIVPSYTQVEQYLRSEQGGPVIVGYYHANERCDDHELSPLARRIGDHIARYTPQAGVLLVYLLDQLLSMLWFSIVFRWPITSFGQCFL